MTPAATATLPLRGNPPCGRSRAWPGWVAGGAAWTALALLSVTQTALQLAHQGAPVAWPHLLAFGLIDWYTCALFLPPLCWLVRRRPLERAAWPRRAPAYVAATLAAAVAKYALMVPLVRALLREPASLAARCNSRRSPRASSPSRSRPGRRRATRCPRPHVRSCRRPTARTRTADIAGGLAPSITDMQFYRAMHAGLGLASAQVTNGFAMVDLPAAAFDRLHARGDTSAPSPRARTCASPRIAAVVVGCRARARRPRRAVRTAAE